MRIRSGWSRHISHPKYNDFISIPLSKDGQSTEKSAPVSRNLTRPAVKFFPVPKLAIKDNITTSDLPTTCSSKILSNYRSPFEAHVVTQHNFGQFPVSGKTNMDEFGMGSHSIHSAFGPVSTKSGHSAGGSSGGSAVAVAERPDTRALGTDTGGSIRLPAAYNGIVGFKPSYGMLSRWGVIPYANSMDTVGILTTTANEARSFYHLGGFDRRDPTLIKGSTWNRIKAQREASHNTRKNMYEDSQKPFAGIKFGVPLEYNVEELSSPIRQAWIEALELLQSYGGTIVPVSLPNTKHALSAYYILAPAEAASNLSKYDGVRYGTRPLDIGKYDGAEFESKPKSDMDHGLLFSATRDYGFGDEVKRRILLGSYTLSSDAIENYFIKAQKIRRLVQRDFDRVFQLQNPLRLDEQFDLSDLHESIELDSKLGPQQIDFIVCPTAPTLPPKVEDLLEQPRSVKDYVNDVFTVPASLAGIPAISIPFPIPPTSQKQGEPHFSGLQIIGQFSDDWGVLDLARQFEGVIEQEYPEFKDPATGAIQARDVVPSPIESGEETAALSDVNTKDPATGYTPLRKRERRAKEADHDKLLEDTWDAWEKLSRAFTSK